MQKRRPCLIVSPDEMNETLRTVLIAPMTTAFHDFPSRVTCQFRGKKGQIALDQIRAVDKRRLVARRGAIDRATQIETMDVLRRMFAD
jgi:mRNA interferase MazF